MKLFKLVTWYPNMFQKLCEMTQFNIPSTFIKIENHLNYFWNNIFVFFTTQQSPALGLTTVPIPNPQLCVGQLYPPITHPWHLVHTHYPPNSYPSVHHHSADELLIAISVAQGPSYPPMRPSPYPLPTHLPISMGGYRVPIAGLCYIGTLHLFP